MIQYTQRYTGREISYNNAKMKNDCLRRLIEPLMKGEKTLDAAGISWVEWESEHDGMPLTNIKVIQNGEDKGTFCIAHPPIK